MPTMEQIALAKEVARNLRQNQTPSEKIIWEAVRNRQLEGFKIYRQHIIWFTYENRESFFIADFYCPEKKQVIEIDGKIHEFQAERDALRTWIMNNLGLKVFRIKNEELRNLNIALDKIKGELQRG